MPITEETLHRAMRHNRQAMESVLEEAYPIVFRLSLSLTGRAGAARQVLHEVLRRSLKVIPKWRRGAVPENWFYHHTVISARGAAQAAGPIDSRDDILVKGSTASADPGYVAFVRALRLLPPQQSEAFVLHHGERLNTRLLGVSMDCSQNAAATHLEAANAALAAIAGEHLSAYEAILHAAHTQLVPPLSDVHPAARTYVTRHLRPRKIKRVLWLIVAVFLTAAALYLWQIRDRISSMIPTNWQNSSPTTQ